MNELHLLYKRETGNRPKFEEIEVTRMKGRWYIDFPDSAVIEMFGCSGTIEFPDPDYIEWLESKLSKLLKL